MWPIPKQICHLDRSEAKWRDLQFCGPIPELFFDRVVMGLPPTQVDEKRYQGRHKIVISTGAYPDFLPHSG
jgi:hypothetical protein